MVEYIYTNKCTDRRAHTHIEDTWQCSAASIFRPCGAGRIWGQRWRRRSYDLSVTAETERSSGSFASRCSCSPRDSDGQSPERRLWEKKNLINQSQKKKTHITECISNILQHWKSSIHGKLVENPLCFLNKLCLTQAVWTLFQIAFLLRLQRIWEKD